MIDLDIIEDGFGCSSPAVCPTCGIRAAYVCHPGDIRCGVCYDGNPAWFYTGRQCLTCGMSAINHEGICLCCGSIEYHDIIY